MLFFIQQDTHIILSICSNLIATLNTIGAEAILAAGLVSVLVQRAKVEVVELQVCGIILLA